LWKSGWRLATGGWLFVVRFCLEVFEDKLLAAGNWRLAIRVKILIGSIRG
jgi:hypothetical protein